MSSLPQIQVTCHLGPDVSIAAMTFAHSSHLVKCVCMCLNSDDQSKWVHDTSLFHVKLMLMLIYIPVESIICIHVNELHVVKPFACTQKNRMYWPSPMHQPIESFCRKMLSNTKGILVEHRVGQS